MLEAAFRSAWGNRCARANELARITLYGGAEFVVRAAAIEAYKALDQVQRAHGYQSRPGCGHGGMNCRPITGGGGLSRHALGLAIDENPCQNPYGPRLITNMPAAMRADILGIRTNSGKQVFRWGGNYSGNKDAMHWEVDVGPADLATGINWSTVRRAGGAPSPTAPPTSPTPPEEDDFMWPIIVRCNEASGHPDRGQVWNLWADGTRTHVPNATILSKLRWFVGFHGGDYQEITDPAEWDTIKWTWAPQTVEGKDRVA